MSISGIILGHSADAKRTPAVAAPAPTAKAVDILIAKQDRTYAEALAWICGQAMPGAQVTLVRRGTEALAVLQEDHPVDYFLMGLNFPDMEGLSLLRQVTQRRDARKIIVVAEIGDELLFPILQTARVDAIIDTGSEPLSAFGEALRLVEEGKVYVSPALHGYLLNRGPGQQTHPDLTPGELRVLRVIGTGENNGEAAAVLGLSEATIQTHRRNIMRKLKVSTSTKMVQESLRLGLAYIDAPRSTPA